MNAIVLDTNAYASLTLGDHDIRHAFLAADHAYVPGFVLGELHAGFVGGTRVGRNQEALARFLSGKRVAVLEAGANTAEIYGHVSMELKRQGTPLPTNDIWIAAQALETDSLLVTYDRHFLQVPGLRVWDTLGRAS